MQATLERGSSSLQAMLGLGGVHAGQLAAGRAGLAVVDHQRHLLGRGA
jgi:hypothetical protein